MLTYWLAKKWAGERWAADLWSASERSLEMFTVSAGTKWVTESKNPFTPREGVAWSSWCTLLYDDAYGKLALLLHLWKLYLSKPLSSNIVFSNVLSSAPFKNKVIFEISEDSCCLLAAFVQREHNACEALMAQGTWPRCHRCVCQWWRFIISS